MKIKELLALLQDMDPEGTISIYDPEDDASGWSRKIESIQPLWTTAAHDANGKADILGINLVKQEATTTARLIAAAPELLAVLKALKQRLDRNGMSGRQLPEYSLLATAIDRAENGGRS